MTIKLSAGTYDAHRTLVLYKDQEPPCRRESVPGVGVIMRAKVDEFELYVFTRPLDLILTVGFDLHEASEAVLSNIRRWSTEKTLILRLYKL